MSEITRYPLCWPPGRPRTASPTSSNFKVHSFARVRDELLNELKLMRARRLILSTNIRLREDGLPLASQSQPRDAGVAVYFELKGRDLSFACDRWRKIEENMQAIRHTINALRGIARWGTGDMVDAAFSGFAQLPAHVPPPPWYVVFCCEPQAPTADVVKLYRELAVAWHPDRNKGDDTRAKEINAAYEAFKRERGL